jgi:hypothetical protein
MNNTHTPGPWEVWGEPGIETRDLSVGPVNGGIAVADIVTTNAHGIATAESISTGHANAALIAAAPELLEACEAALLRDDIADGELGDFLRAAIAKAKGGR